MGAAKKDLSILAQGRIKSDSSLGLFLGFFYNIKQSR